MPATISDDGTTIAGFGSRNGRNEAFVATIPEPASLGLLVLAAGGLMLVRRRGAGAAGQRRA